MSRNVAGGRALNCRLQAKALIEYALGSFEGSILKNALLVIDHSGREDDL